MILEKVFKEVVRFPYRLPSFLKKGQKVLSWIYTFGIINLSFVFFRSESLEQANMFLKGLFSGGWRIHGKILDQFSDIIEIRLLNRMVVWGEIDPALFLCCTLFLLIGTCVFTKNAGERAKTSSFSLGQAVSTVVLLVWCIVSLSSISEFLYFEF